jgi:FG-GAP repeat protein
MGQTQVWRVDGRIVHESLGHGLAITADFDGDGLPDILAGAPGIESSYETQPGHVNVIGSVSGAVLLSIASDRMNDLFGSAVATINDVDGDGIVDFLVGIPEDARGGQHAGAVQIRSGATQAKLLDLLGPNTGSYFGAVVAALGDLDGDGIPDFAAGYGGVVDACSGANGSLIWRAQGPTHTGFGCALAPFMDLDGDGVGDILVGSTADYTQGGGGAAYVVSGATGVVLRSFVDKLWSQDGFGSRVADAGDVDADGVDDVLVGDPAFTTDPWGYNSRGAVYLISGASGAILFRQIGSYDLETVGYSVAGCPDLDADGVPDFAFADGYGIDLFSGRNGFLRQLKPNVSQRWQIAPFPDLDGDTVPDFVCGNPIAPDQSGASMDAGVVIAVDGSHANTIAIRYGAAYDDMVGAAVAVLADVDGDGWRDVLVGNTADPGTWAQAHAGEVQLLSGRDGSVLRIHDGASNGDEYGSAITTVPDLDGDGTPDYAIASSHVFFGAPFVDVRSGATGSQLLTLPAPYFVAGAELSLAAGRDPGGRIVLAVGDAYASQVELYDLTNGSHLSPMVGDVLSSFGASVASLGDVDGDQVSDWLVGAPSSSHSAYLGGSAMILSGASGTVLGRIDGTKGDGVGAAVAAIDDLDGDGVLDALVGAPNAGTTKRGAVVAISGASAAPLLAFSGSEPYGSIGSTVAALGDVNRDGVADFATTQTLYDATGRVAGEEVLVVSGATRGLLARVQPATPGGFGKAIASLTGDFTSGVDPDGIPDLLVGDPVAGTGGAAWLIRLDDLMLQATPETMPVPHTVELDTRGGPPGNLVALALTGFDSTPFFVLLAFGSFGADGIWTLSATAPPALKGHTATLRSLAIGASGKLVDSSDVLLTFQ